MNSESNKLDDAVPSDSAVVSADVISEDEGLLSEDASQVVLEDLPIKEITTFEEAGLTAKVIQAAKDIGWAAPTPVQGMCLPLTIKGRDVAGFAQTGTGKTGVFILTIAERMGAEAANVSRRNDIATPEVIVLTPTRELTMQIDDDAKRVLAPLGIKSMPVFGGVDVDKQAAQFKDQPRMIVATPGRLKDFQQRKLIDLSQVKIFICDEADRMFDMGFIDDVEFFLDKIPENAQKLLFSATTNDNVKELAFEYLNHPAYVSVTPETMTPEKIEQHAIICDSSNKLRVILGLFNEHKPDCAIVFTNTKMVAEWLHFKLNGNGIQADLITGDLPQSKRIALIKRIKEGNLKALIATDVASRGLHISKVTHVYNFDVPDDPANYVHRIGRTARAGASGRSYTLVCDDYGENMLAVNDMLGTQIAPKAEWFNPDYLSIVDSTGNPFEIGGPLYRSPKDRDDRRKGAFGSDDRKGGKGKFQGKAPQGGRDDRGGYKGRDSQPQHRSDGPRPFKDEASNGYKKHPRRGPDSRDHRNKNHLTGATSNVPARIDSQPKGIFGWIKKIWFALLGR